MSQTIRAHFDGRTIVPDEPLDLPAGEELEVTVTRTKTTGASPSAGNPLAALARLARSFPARPGAPADRAAQHDHYLYGLPKRP